MADVEFLRKACQCVLIRPYAILFEHRFGTGYGSENEQRFDAWAISLYPSDRLERTAFEFKVSRKDYRKELRNPDKRALALKCSNRFYFVTPAGLIKHDTVPPECGLIEVTAVGPVVVKRAPYRESGEPSWIMLASICRRIYRGELDLVGERIPSVDGRREPPALPSV